MGGSGFAYVFAFAMCGVVLLLVAASMGLLYGVAALQRRRGGETRIEAVSIRESSEDD